MGDAVRVRRVAGTEGRPVVTYHAAVVDAVTAAVIVCVAVVVAIVCGVPLPWSAAVYAPLGSAGIVTVLAFLPVDPDDDPVDGDPLRGYVPPTGDPVPAGWKPPASHPGSVWVRPATTPDGKTPPDPPPPPPVRPSNGLSARMAGSGPPPPRDPADGGW